MDARSAEWGQGAGMGLRGPVPDRLGTGVVSWDAPPPPGSSMCYHTSWVLSCPTSHHPISNFPNCPMPVSPTIL